jgi:pyruvate,water dikinase
MDVLTGPTVLKLRDEAARNAGLTGAKASSLARAASGGLPVLPGIVLTTTGTRRASGAADDGLRAAWASVSEQGRRSLVVRSSSTAEDGAASSMAGRFTSVLDVQGWPAFRAAVDEVIASGDLGGEMAVLVQPFLDPAYGGVLFGADPVTARRDRMVVAVVRGGPHRLVAGQVSGDRWTLTPHGRVVHHDHGVDEVALSPARRWALTGLARRAAALFGGPQDIEWAYDRAGKLWLLQSRPITTLPSGAPTGPVYGPGPLAETFPDPLWPLEEDLWLDPLRVALRESLSLMGTTPRRTLRRRPLVLSVGGRVAVDLDAVGAAPPPRHRLLARLDPRPPGRRVVASWRVGRLRAALPLLARDLLGDLDGQLRGVPSLRTLSNDDLLHVLERSRRSLVAVHGHEVLMGLLASESATSPSAAGTALRHLAAARAQGLDDEAIVARHPVTLVLRPPTVGPSAPLPPVPTLHGAAPSADDGDPAVVREALRARVRLLQELGARAARELGRRLDLDVRPLHLEELTLLVNGGDVPDALDRTVDRGPVLPVAFRLAPDGLVVALPGGSGDGGGTGAGGGRAMGIVHVGDDPPEGAVLVVRHLEPSLAAVLPRVSAVVAETGSVLSHLAILAREMGVPVVVGAADALARFAPGTTVLVDGATGDVVVS